MLTAYKVTCANGASWTTNMAAGVTLEEASDILSASGLMSARSRKKL